MNNFRCRNFSGVFYPESCPPDFQKVIEDFGVKCCLSPLHEPDEEQKKPHYHIVFLFSGNKNIEQVRQLIINSNKRITAPKPNLNRFLKILYKIISKLFSFTNFHFCTSAPYCAKVMPK